MNGQYNVLFLCTGNSARSILAEALANQLGNGRLHAFSAGSHPRGEVHRVALEVMNKAGLPTAQLRSKPWDEFSAPGAPQMDLIITVCDRAAGESCPVWPGQPVTAHWGIEDPADATGTPEQIQKAFTNAMLLLQHRISLLLALKTEALDRLVLQAKIREIGQQS